jgi:hypothetical protein
VNKLSFNQELRTKKEVVKQELSSYEIKRLVEKIGLAQAGWLPYHCKSVKTLGAIRYVELADMASKGTNPYTLMSYLLKQELLKAV